MTAQRHCRDACCGEGTLRHRAVPRGPRRETGYGERGGSRMTNRTYHCLSSLVD